MQYDHESEEGSQHGTLKTTEGLSKGKIQYDMKDEKALSSSWASKDVLSRALNPKNPFSRILGLEIQHYLEVD